jgi:hypothetical protein
MNPIPALRPGVAPFSRRPGLRCALTLAALFASAETASGFIDSLRVNPTNPSPSDEVTVAVKGSFPSFCWQVTDMICGSQPGFLTVDIMVVYYAYTSCPPPIVEYEIQCPNGPLPAGDYTVRVAEHHDICDEYGCTSYPFYATRYEYFTVGGPVGVTPTPSGDAVTLLPAWPNPSAGRTSTAFVVPARTRGSVELQIVDVAGHEVRRLVRGEAASGRHVIEWDGRTDAGTAAPAGVYFFSGAIAGRRVRTPVVLLR